MGIYRTVYDRSLADPEGFWAEAAAALHWDGPWDRVLDATHAPFHRWFEGGRLNTCYNAVDPRFGPDADHGDRAQTFLLRMVIGDGTSNASIATE